MRMLLKKFIKEKYKDGESTDDIKDQVLFDLSYQPTARDVEKVEKENEALKLRCCALSRGTMCLYCQLECKHRTEEYRGDGRE